MSHYLKLTFCAEENEHKLCDNWENRILPFADSKIFFSSIRSARKLTQGEDVKEVYQTCLDPKDAVPGFSPGDTIGIIPQNSPIIVEKLLQRLNLDNVADKPCKLAVSEQTTKKNPILPKHLPPLSTLRRIFINHVDLQTPPKKLFLKSLIKHTENAEEIGVLEKICSTDGSKEYGELIAGPGRNILDLLNVFPSCNPPIETILENLPALLPRPYSISSAPGEKLQITFFVTQREDGHKGLCTGWLQEQINVKSQDVIPFYFRKPNEFHMPLNNATPMILIATGTGIAPFKAFLQHRFLQIQQEFFDNADVWLFYGCRYSDRDFLYKNEIVEYLRSGTLNGLDVAFSREGEEKCYVQHRIEKNGERFTDWIMNREAKIYVCGDLKTMVRDVKEAIVKNLRKFGVMSEESAVEYFHNLEKQKRFIIDSWI